MSSWIRRLLTSRRLSDGYENSRRLSDGCGHIYKKKIIFVIFGTVKKKIHAPSEVTVGFWIEM